MVIRTEQLTAISKASAANFEDRVLGKLNKSFPSESRSAGESSLRETIRQGIKRASGYGITAQRDVCKYVDLMVAFGRNFDEDPKRPWAPATLNDPRLKGNPTGKMQRLYAAAKVEQSELQQAEDDADAAFWFDDVDNVVQPCSSDHPPTVISPRSDHWIEIALVDEEGEPVPDEEYRIKLPGGSVVTGRLDSRGLARVDGIQPGTCSYTFPNVDHDFWRQA